MNTRYLEYALEIENVGTISQAATNLFMAQPNLSKCIKELESELGYDVFVRTPFGMKPTEKGVKFLYHARKMLEQMQEIQQIAARDDESRHSFKISIPRGSYISEGISSMISEISFHEHLKITVHETNSRNTINNITDHGYNMGIIRVPLIEENYFQSLLKKNGLVSETIWEFEFVLVMSEMHPLAHKPQLVLNDLTPFIEISHADIEHPQDVYQYADAEPKREAASEKAIYVYERGSQFDLLANVRDTYMWVSPIPKSTLERNHLIQRMCCDTHNRYKDILIYRHGYELTEYDKLFQKKLYEAKVEVASEKFM